MQNLIEQVLPQLAADIDRNPAELVGLGTGKDGDDDIDAEENRAELIAPIPVLFDDGLDDQASELRRQEVANERQEVED